LVPFRALRGRFVISRFVALLLIGVFFVQSPVSLTAQSIETEATDDGPDISYDPSRPVPYDPEEFPQWARDLRRGEIIALGAFPLSMVITSFAYELGRFGYYSARDGGAAGEYAPWFFSTSAEGAFTNGERIGLVLTSAVLSVGVGFADYLLGRRERSEDDR
jgi:hypothetical protein